MMYYMKEKQTTVSETETVKNAGLTQAGMGEEAVW